MQPGETTTKQHDMAERYAALSRVGTALMSELDEARLLHLIADTARELTGATFAAFTLRPVDEEGRPLVASEGNLFHLAAVVGHVHDRHVDEKLAIHFAEGHGERLHKHRIVG